MYNGTIIQRNIYGRMRESHSRLSNIISKQFSANIPNAKFHSDINSQREIDNN